MCYTHSKETASTITDFNEKKTNVQGRHRWSKVAELQQVMIYIFRPCYT